VFEYVFGSTTVVKDIDVARSIGVGSTRMVTLQGDLIETSGAMSGGFRGKSRRAGFQQKEVTEKMTELEKTVASDTTSWAASGVGV